MEEFVLGRAVRNDVEPGFTFSGALFSVTVVFLHWGWEMDPMRKLRLFTVVVLALALSVWTAHETRADKSSLGRAKEAFFKHDFKKAHQYLVPLAGDGQADAQAMLGSLLLVGLGAPADVAEAQKLFRSAADQGNALGEYYLSIVYRDGLGVSADLKKAQEWLTKASEKGYASAQVALGLLLAQGGAGVPEDDAEAVKWFRAAATKDNSEAQAWLGNAYEGGGGTIKADPKEGARWYQKSAQQGNTDGATWLGELYAKRNGVTKDLVLAFAWLSVAAEQGGVEASKRLAALQKKMSSDEIKKAKALYHKTMQSILMHNVEKANTLAGLAEQRAAAQSYPALRLAVREGA